MLHRTNAIIVALLASLLIVAPTVADEQVVEYELDNGLEVILRPVVGAKQAAVMTLFDIGELHDPEGRSGLAHLMEHMLITGATDVTEATTSEQWFMRYDGQANAQTGLDYTVIAGVVDEAAVNDELVIAAQRMQTLTFDQDVLEREKRRVYAELDNMYENMPWLVALNSARQIIDPMPQGMRRGGVQQQIEPVTAQDLKNRYDQYYKPGNAKLIVVGAFDADAIVETIEDVFGDIPAGETLPAKREQPEFEKPASMQTATAHGSFGDDVPTDFAVVAYTAPELTNAADMATFLLIVPRIYREMLSTGVRPSQYVQPVTYPVLDDPGGLYLRLPLKPGDDGKAAVQAIRDAVDRASAIDTRKPLDRAPLQQMYGSLLGLVRVPDNVILLNLYGEAFRLGRVRQLDMDIDGMREAIMDLNGPEVNETAARLFDSNRSVAFIVRSEE